MWPSVNRASSAVRYGTGYQYRVPVQGTGSVGREPVLLDRSKNPGTVAAYVDMSDAVFRFAVSGVTDAAVVVVVVVHHCQSMADLGSPTLDGVERMALAAEIARLEREAAEPLFEARMQRELVVYEAEAAAQERNM